MEGCAFLTLIWAFNKHLSKKWVRYKLIDTLHMIKFIKLITAVHYLKYYFENMMMVQAPHSLRGDFVERINLAFTLQPQPTRVTKPSCSNSHSQKRSLLQNSNETLTLQLASSFPKCNREFPPENPQTCHENQPEGSYPMYQLFFRESAAVIDKDVYRLIPVMCPQTVTIFHHHGMFPLTHTLCPRAMTPVTQLPLPLKR